ncbi:MAG: sporulation integral membrane protein YtvI [Clostridia bacterium]|nr:sporulation integral membrane protein YtvI [Clostridia bacterium]
MEKYKKTVYIGLSILIYLVFAYFVLKYALGIILPFLFSLGVVVLSRPTVNKICSKIKLPKSIISVSVTVIILTLFFGLLSLCLSVIFSQIGNLTSKIIEYLSSNDNYIIKALDFLEGLKDKFPFLSSENSSSSSVYSIATEMAISSLKNLSDKLTNAVSVFIVALPEIIITVIVIILALFYFSKDYEKITVYIKRKLPTKISEKLPIIKKDIIYVLTSYLRSYLILFLLTFTELFVGLLILKIENAFLISVIIAIVDILPILGTGIVLIPWSAILFITGNTTLGFGILVLYAIIYFVRQIAEPKIVSAHMNVHPIVAIISMYAGLKIAGFGGMIFAPLLVFLTKTVYSSFKNEKNIENQAEM